MWRIRCWQRRQIPPLAAHRHVIQRYMEQANGQADSAPASVDRVLASSGRPLEPALQQDMEQRFGRDFSQVRVHSGAAAEQSALDVNAHAYTVGHDMVFGTGQFAPGTHEGRRLIAHELAHVVQQRADVDLRSGISEAHESYKQHADEVARVVTEGQATAVLLSALPAEFRPRGGDRLDSPASGSWARIQRSVQRNARRHLRSRIQLPGCNEQVPDHRKAQHDRETDATGIAEPGLAFVKMLYFLDEALLGNATQSWGTEIYGMEDGQGSTAAKASKGARIGAASTLPRSWS